MLRTRIYTLGVVFWVAACSGPSGSQKAAAPDTPTPTPEEHGTFWQLPDDSELNVELTPWPPQSDVTTTVKVDIGVGDWSEKVFGGNVQYRVAASENGAEPWYPLPKIREDEGAAYFEGPVVLPKGKSYVQFTVTGAPFEQPVPLTDWSVEAK